jgi:hypothetical protein
MVETKEGFVIPTLSREALALLGFLHRADHGGPPPPQGFQKGYNELLALEMAIREAGRVKITDKGEAALRARYRRD